MQKFFIESFNKRFFFFCVLKKVYSSTYIFQQGRPNERQLDEALAKR